MTRKAFLFLFVIFVTALIWNCRPRGDKRKTVFRAKDIEARNLVQMPGKSVEALSVNSMQTYELGTALTGDIFMVKNFQNPSILFSSTYATSPTPPQFEDILQSLKITSLSDFDSTHLAGTDLTGLFRTSSKEFLNSATEYPDMYEYDQQVNFELKQRPIMDSVHQFIIQAKFQNAGTLVDTAEAVTFER